LPPQVQGEETETGNIAADPEFVDAVNLNCGLLVKSPHIDTGDDPGEMIESLPFDLGSNPRILDGDPDII